MQNSKLKIYGVIGYPLGHTLSPYMHNDAFSKLKIKAIYLPLSVEPKNLKSAINTLKTAGICGFNVTIPFKTSCMRYLDRIDKLVSMIGAVNTVVLKKNKLSGYNTDAAGFIKSLKADLGFSPKGKSVFVLGAGGAARAVCFALAKEGAREIFIVDVIKSKAVSLARNIRKNFPKCLIEVVTTSQSHNVTSRADLIVNATPLGMKKTDPLPINPKLLRKGLAVYDLVYNPSPTKLVKAAKAKGVNAANGLGMLLYQGAEAFKLWTRRKAPVEVMKQALERHI
ncbi:MAG: shikimate dehydrogenase [Candidatus Omnitrophota bacterium]